MEPANKRKRPGEKLGVAVVLGLVVLGAVALRLISPTGAGLYSSPDKIRIHAREYQRTMKPPPVILADTNARLPVFQITRSNQVEHLSHPYVPSGYADVLGQVVVHHVQTGERVEAEGVALQLQRIGTRRSQFPARAGADFILPTGRADSSPLS